MANNRIEVKNAFNNYFNLAKKIISTLSCKNPILNDAFITLYKVKEIIDSDICELPMNEAIYIKSAVKIVMYLIDSTLQSSNYENGKLDLLLLTANVDLLCLYNSLNLIIEK